MRGWTGLSHSPTGPAAALAEACLPIMSLDSCLAGSSPGYGPIGPEGGPRPPPPSYPGSQPGPRGTLAMERWPEEQMIQPPHPSQIRPRMEGFGARGPGPDTRMGMRPGFAGPMRPMRLPQSPGGQPQGPPGFPGPGMPGAPHPGGGQYPPQRHPVQYMHQVCPKEWLATDKRLLVIF